MCKVLCLSRSGYYKRKKNGQSKREIEEELLLVKIKEVYSQSRGIYGSPRITEALRMQGVSCNRKRIALIMQQSGIRAKTVKRYKRTTNSNHKKKVSENKLNQNFYINTPNKVWVSDITYPDKRGPDIFSSSIGFILKKSHWLETG